MFQTFEDRSDRVATPGRVAALRALLREENLTGYVVPHADANQSEYLPASEERLAWLTGFTGSAGTAIVLLDEAAVFVDGRYTTQASHQVDHGTFTVVPSGETPPTKWLSRVKSGDRIGYDPWHLTLAQLRRFERVAAEAGATMVPMDSNPIDRLWTDRPPVPLGAVELHPIERAGEAAADKLARVGTAIAAKKADAAVLGEADAIAWTFNIRGRDVAHNPVPLAFALLRPQDRPVLYVDGRKLSNTVRDALADIADIAEPTRLASDLATMGRAGLKVLVDPDVTAAAIATAVMDGGGTLVESSDPTALLKARKNSAELDGTREAHRRDGVAMVRFLAWLDRMAPSGSVDEIGAVEALEGFRVDTAKAEGSELVDVSFDSISGAGSNGAIVHYRVTRATNRKLEPGTLFLIDSGGQYRDGTTDITRTVAIGEPDDEMRDRFTRVLKGHIALGRAIFPVGTSGAQLDTLARVALWDAGLDYDHGTGHGVGSFLSVHEGPARISKIGTVPLEPGMILSNEPGYYRVGAWGIRIENLIAVREPETLEGGDRPMLSFETLTLAPIDRRLIAVPLLTPEERGWLDAYHARVWSSLSPSLDPDDAEWLKAATAPLR